MRSARPQLVRPRKWSLALGALALSGAVALAAGGGDSKTRLRLERIDTTDFASDGVVRVYASVVELEGSVVEDKGAGAFTLLMNGRSVGKPEKMTRFQVAGEPLDLVLVVESSALYGPQKPAPPPPPPPPAPPGARGAKGAKGQKGAKAPAAPAPKAPPPAPGPAGQGKKKRAPAPPPATGAPNGKVREGGEPLEKVKDALRTLLEGLHPKWRVFVIDYGGDVTPHPPFRPAPAAGAAIDELATDEESGDLRLSDAVRAAIAELNRVKIAEDQSPPRRLVVVISDGINMQMDRKTFRALGDAAQKAKVPIHTIAYSPTDDRGPLLNLGEISKRSNGTFRWARSGEDVRNQIETLADELNKQYVLTFKLDTSSLEKKRFQLQCDDLTSNEYSIGPDTGQGPPKTRSYWWVWVLVGVGALGAVAVVIVLVRRARAAGPKGKKKPAARPQPQAQPGYAAPAMAAQGGAPAGGPRDHAGRPLTGTLLVVSGALTGQRIPVAFNAPILVGKGNGNLLITDDPTVSTTHAQVTLDPRGMFVLQDLGSTNGTFVNGQRITQPVQLRDGDLVRFGNTQVKFRSE